MTPDAALAPTPRKPVDQVLDQLRADTRVDAGMLAIRVDALARFARVTDPYLPADWLQQLRKVVARAGERLALSRGYTVVALTGTTGSGKSSLFNVLAGQELSPVGVRRPTTGAAYGCVWGAVEEATPLLDRVGVPPAHRFARSGDTGLHGMVLLDLPDFDSIERDHAQEVDRLLELVDLVVWVLDPQKYADQVVHDQYLRRFRRHQAVSVVALNQADLLGPDDVAQLLGDLRRLLAADGNEGPPAIATSAVAGPTGHSELRSTLERAVAGRRSALQRLAADVDGVVAELADLVDGNPLDPPAGPDPELVGLLAEAVDVPATAAAVAAGYQRVVLAAAAGPLARWLANGAAEPELPAAGAADAERPSTAAAGQVHPSGGGVDAERPVDPPPPLPVTAAQRAAVSLAARALTARAGAGLPPPWPDAVAMASRSRLDELPAVLSAEAARLARPERTALAGWRLLGAGQWLLATVAGLGLAWQVVSWVFGAVGLPLSPPRAGPVTWPVLLFAGGLGAGGLLAVLARPAARWAAARARVRAASRLRRMLAAVAQEYLLTPVQTVRTAYAEARSALRAAGADRTP